LASTNGAFTALNAGPPSSRITAKSNPYWIVTTATVKGEIFICGFQKNSGQRRKMRLIRTHKDRELDEAYENIRRLQDDKRDLQDEIVNLKSELERVKQKVGENNDKLLRIKTIVADETRHISGEWGAGYEWTERLARECDHKPLDEWRIHPNQLRYLKYLVGRGDLNAVLEAIYKITGKKVVTYYPTTLSDLNLTQNQARKIIEEVTGDKVAAEVDGLTK
jgi:hypothetical protein